MFHSFDELLDAARARGPISIAVAAAHDPDVIEALKRAHELHLAEGILVGKGSEIRALAREGGFELSDSQIVNEPDPAAATRQGNAPGRGGRAGGVVEPGPWGAGGVSAFPTPRPSTSQPQRRLRGRPLPWCGKAARGC